jgi:hypothetical protein
MTAVYHKTYARKLSSKAKNINYKIRVYFNFFLTLLIYTHMIILTPQ